MISLEREAHVLRMGEDDARAGIGSRADAFETVSEQLAYVRGYANPDPTKILNAIMLTVFLVAMLAWSVWGFSVHIDVLKYGTTIALSTGWDAFGYWGLEVPMLVALLCLGRENP